MCFLEVTSPPFTPTSPPPPRHTHTHTSQCTQTLDTISTPALRQLSHTPSSTHISHPLTSHIPAPLNTLTQNAARMFPWQHFLFSHGAFPASLDHHAEVGAYVYITLAPFSHTERCLANGELLGMSLLLEDVLQSSELAMAALAQQNGASTPTPTPHLKVPMSARRLSITVEHQVRETVSITLRG